MSSLLKELRMIKVTALADRQLRSALAHFKNVKPTFLMSCLRKIGSTADRNRNPAGAEHDSRDQLKFGVSP